MKTLPLSAMKTSRRAFLKLLSLGSAGIAASACAPFAATHKSGKRPPNVVLILADDQGTLDLNCYGAKDLHTPHLDRLAARGTRFTQFYVGAPVCSPSRAALLTGRYPRRAGLTNNAGREKGLPSEQRTIAEHLRAAGYRTGLFGKWHLGEIKELSPLSQGFDEFFGHKKGCIDNYSHFFYWSGPNLHDLWRGDEEIFEDDGKYFPDLIVRETRRFMTENRDRPFFIYAALNFPHYPVQPYARHRELYKDIPEPRASYAAFVTTLDEKVGEIIDTIDDLGLREDTLIIFLSDHGHSVEVRTNSGGGYAGPYRGHKFTLWEGGIRVPCIVSQPGTLPEGAVRDQMAASMDWFPTIAHYCGAEDPGASVDGRNLSAVIESPQASSPHPALHWQHANHDAIREGDWKLVLNGPPVEFEGRRIKSDKVFLTNLKDDPSELSNRAAEESERVKRMQQRHQAWAQACDENQ